MNEVIEYGEEFKSLYSSAKVRLGEVLCSKGVITLPLFVATATEDTFLDGKIVPISIPDEELLGTGYSDFEFSGLTLNAESHLTFWLYINALSQKVGGSKITVNVREMLPHIGRVNDDFHIYNKYFAEFLNRIRHTRVRYTIKSKFTTIDSSLIGDFEIIGDGVYVIHLGRFIIDSLLKDSFTHKIGIRKADNVQAGLTRILKDKLSVMIFKDSGVISIDTLFAVLRLKKKNKAERDASFKLLNKAINNLKDKKIGFIVSTENIKPGKSITGIKFTINRNVDDKGFDEFDDEPFTFDQPSKSLPAVASVRAPMLPSVVLDEQLAKIGAMFDSIGINPEAIEAKAIQAERIEAEKKEKAISSLSSAMARKANKQGMEG